MLDAVKFLPTQKGYYINSTTWFVTNDLEVEKLAQHNSRNSIAITDYIRRYIGEEGSDHDVIAVDVYKIRQPYKRSRTDSCKLLVATLRLSGGNLFWIAKRFTNNQYLTIR